MSVLKEQVAVPRRRRGRGPRLPPLAPLAKLALLGIFIAVLFGIAVKMFFGGGDSKNSVPSALLIELEDSDRILIEHGEDRTTVTGFAKEDTYTPREDMMTLAVSKDDLIRFVDGLGGIWLNVPAPIEYRGEDEFPVRLAPGMRRLSGDRVAIFLEQPGASRQGTVRAVTLGILTRTAELIEEGYDIVDLVDAVFKKNLSGQAVQNVGRLSGFLVAASKSGPANVIVDWNLSAKPTPVPERRAVKVRILNGVGVPGLAAQAAARLNRRDFQIIETANADNFRYAKTIIRGNSLSAAREVEAALGLGQAIGHEIDTADVEIILGHDARGRW